MTSTNNFLCCSINVGPTLPFILQVLLILLKWIFLNLWLIQKHMNHFLCACSLISHILYQQTDYISPIKSAFFLTVQQIVSKRLHIIQYRKTTELMMQTLWNMKFCCKAAITQHYKHYYYTLTPLFRVSKFSVQFNNCKVIKLWNQFSSGISSSTEDSSVVIRLESV